MKFKMKITSLIMCCAIALGSTSPAFADSSSVVTLGADLTDSQKESVLKYFGVTENEVVILDVNNQDERKYLEGVASDAQIGNKTFSCAYVEPTKSGSGINVKTANLTYVTSSMIANTLATCGVTDANVVAMTPLTKGVSGTGALTGVMKAFEDATGEKLDEEKKEIASEELVTTSELGDEIGQDKAAGIVNDVKSEIIKNGTQDTTQIADTINNVTNNYNITLTPDQEQQLKNLMSKISEQDYDYDKMKNTFKNVSSIVDKNLGDLGEKVNRSEGFFKSIGDWFSNLFSSDDKDLGIIAKTNDDLLGDSAQIDATDTKAITLKETDNKGFFEKIGDWFSNAFGSSNNSNTQNKETNTNNTSKNESTDTQHNSTDSSTQNKDDKSNSENINNNEKKTDSSSESTTHTNSTTETNTQNNNKAN